MRILRGKILLILLFWFSGIYGQHGSDLLPDTLLYEYRICKLPVPVTFFFVQPVTREPVPATTIVSRKLLLTASGEASYQRFEREGSSNNLLLINSASEIATLRMNLVYKETYPFAVFFRYNQSSPFQLENQYEFNISFDDRGYKELIRDKLAGVIKNKFLQKQALLLGNYDNIFKQFQYQKEMLQSPAYLQQAVQSRFQQSAPPSIPSLPSMNGTPMQQIAGRLPAINGIGNPTARLQSAINNLPTTEGVKERIKDSINSRATIARNEAHGKLEQRKDSLEGLLKKYEDSLVLHKEKYNKQLDSLNKELAELTSTNQLKKYADKEGLKDSLVKNRWADVLMKTNLRVGKFILNSSELTVNNIFLHGASIKYGDEKFIQVSAGYYDFAFRELFNLRRDTIKKAKQSVIGIKFGKTDGRNLKAVNFYIGRKEKPGSLSGELRTVAGLSAERKIYISKNLRFDVELAKSTTRVNSAADKQVSTFKDLFGGISTRTIGGYAAVKAFLPKTKTDAEMNYRYWGQQFESFNASQFFNPQSNLSAKISQPFFNRKLTITSGIKYTDFKSYGIASNIKSKTIFASANATMRIKKLPIISVGYYPGSQLYWMEGNKLYEYFYYILNATASHYFLLRKVPMQAVFTWNKFYNRYTDSLVSGSQSYYNIFWTAWVGKFSYQANYSRQELEANKLSTAEAGISYSGTKLRIGGTLKWNFTSGVTKMGYSGSMGLSLGKIGTVNLIYDRSYLPERTGLFIPVTTGQLQIIKPLKFRIWQKG